MYNRTDQVQRHELPPIPTEFVESVCEAGETVASQPPLLEVLQTIYSNFLNNVESASNQYQQFSNAFGIIRRDSEFKALPELKSRTLINSFIEYFEKYLDLAPSQVRIAINSMGKCELASKLLAQNLKSLGYTEVWYMNCTKDLLHFSSHRLTLWRHDGIFYAASPANAYNMSLQIASRLGFGLTPSHPARLTHIYSAKTLEVIVQLIVRDEWGTDWKIVNIDVVEP